MNEHTFLEVDRSPSSPLPFELDRSIRRAVEMLQAAGGVKTFESCEGGRGHAYPAHLSSPLLRFMDISGRLERALEVCLNTAPCATYAALGSF